MSQGSNIPGVELTQEELDHIRDNIDRLEQEYLHNQGLSVAWRNNLESHRAEKEIIKNKLLEIENSLKKAVHGTDDFFTIDIKVLSSDPNKLQQRLEVLRELINDYKQGIREGYLGKSRPNSPRNSGQAGPSGYRYPYPDDSATSRRRDTPPPSPPLSPREQRRRGKGPRTHFGKNNKLKRLKNDLLKLKKI